MDLSCVRSCLQCKYSTSPTVAVGLAVEELNDIHEEIWFSSAASCYQIQFPVLPIEPFDSPHPGINGPQVKMLSCSGQVQVQLVLVEELLDTFDGTTTKLRVHSFVREVSQFPFVNHSWINPQVTCYFILLSDAPRAVILF